MVLSCPVCGQAICRCPETPEQTARAAEWAAFLRLSVPDRRRAQPPTCYTCGALSSGRSSDGGPLFTCRHVAKAS